MIDWLTNYRNLLSNLGEDQRRAVEAICEPDRSKGVLILAAAGAGKTYTLVAALARLINGPPDKPQSLLGHPLPPKDLIATTFSRSGGEELRERLAQVSNPDYLSELRRIGQIGTFHSVAYRHLISQSPEDWDKKYNATLPYPGRMTDKQFVASLLRGSEDIWKLKKPLDLANVDSHIWRIPSLRDSSGEVMTLPFRNPDIAVWSKESGISEGDYLTAIGKLRSRNLRVTQVDPASKEVSGLPHLWAIWRILEHWKEEHDLFDFHDMLTNFLNNPLRPKVIAVDEVQDNSTVQLKIAMSCSQDFPIMIGDTRQCIPEGEEVLTPLGWIPIEELEERDEVLSWTEKGLKPQRIARKSITEQHERAIQFRLSGGGAFKATGNHVLFSQVPEDSEALVIQGGKVLSSSDPLADPGQYRVHSVQGTLSDMVVRRTQQELDRGGVKYTIPLEKGPPEECARILISPGYSRFVIEEATEDSVRQRLLKAEGFYRHDATAIWYKPFHTLQKALDFSRRLYPSQWVGESLVLGRGSEVSVPGVAGVPARFAEHTCIGMEVPCVVQGEELPTFQTVVRKKLVPVSRCFDLEIDHAVNFIVRTPGSDSGVIVHNSIYEWRGADPSKLVELAKSDQLDVFSIPQTRRSGSSIVALGNIVCINPLSGKRHRWSIGEDTIPMRRVDPETLSWVEISGKSYPVPEMGIHNESFPEHPGAIRLLSPEDWPEGPFQSTDREAEVFASEIEEVLAQGIPASELVILCRVREVMAIYAERLMSRKIPVNSEARIGDLFLKGSCFSLLCWTQAVLSDSLAALLEKGALSHPKLGVSLRILRKLLEYAHLEHWGLRRTLGWLCSLHYDSPSLKRLGIKFHSKLRAVFRELQAEHREWSKLEWIPLMQALGKWICPSMGSNAPYVNEVKAVEGDRLLTLIQRAQSHPNMLALIQNLYSLDAIPSDPNGVRIQTIHSSKGLQWSMGWASLTTDVMPHSRAEGDLSEEIRLFYVLVTRMKDVLTLSYSQVDHRGKSVGEKPSKFMIDYVLPFLRKEDPQEKVYGLKLACAGGPRWAYQPKSVPPKWEDTEGSGYILTYRVDDETLEVLDSEGEMSSYPVRNLRELEEQMRKVVPLTGLERQAELLSQKGSRNLRAESQDLLDRIHQEFQSDADLGESHKQHLMALVEERVPAGTFSALWDSRPSWFPHPEGSIGLRLVISSPRELSSVEQAVGDGHKWSTPLSVWLHDPLPGKEAPEHHLVRKGSVLFTVDAREGHPLEYLFVEEDQIRRVPAPQMPDSSLENFGELRREWRRDLQGKIYPLIREHFQSSWDKDPLSIYLESREGSDIRSQRDALRTLHELCAGSPFQIYKERGVYHVTLAHGLTQKIRNLQRWNVQRLLKSGILVQEGLWFAFVWDHLYSPVWP